MTCKHCNQRHLDHADDSSCLADRLHTAQLQVSELQKQVADPHAALVTCEAKFKALAEERDNALRQIGELEASRKVWQDKSDTYRDQRDRLVIDKREMDRLNQELQKFSDGQAETLRRGITVLAELVEATGPVLDELVKANPYDRRDVRFPSKAEAALRKVLGQVSPDLRPKQEGPLLCPHGNIHEIGWSICGRCEDAGTPRAPERKPLAEKRKHEETNMEGSPGAL